MLSFVPRLNALCGVMALLVGAPSDSPAQGAAVRTPEVRPLDERGLRDLLKIRKGRALVMNVWATWCQPCIEEFPGLVRLDSLNRSRGLDVVTVSIDFEDEVDEKVRPFLRRMHAAMPAFVNAFPTPSDLINALHADWSGAIPATFFYDRTGTLVTYVVGLRSFKEFQALADKALQRAPARR